jgi:hypothetical protein
MDGWPVSLCVGRPAETPEDPVEEIGLKGRLGPVHPSITLRSFAWIIAAEFALAIARSEIA